MGGERDSTAASSPRGTREAPSAAPLRARKARRDGLMVPPWYSCAALSCRGRSVDALPVVHGVDLLLELLRRRLPLHLHGGRQLAGLLREVAIENREPLDGLV